MEQWHLECGVWNVELQVTLIYETVGLETLGISGKIRMKTMACGTVVCDRSEKMERAQEKSLE